MLLNHDITAIGLCTGEIDVTGHQLQWLPVDGEDNSYALFRNESPQQPSPAIMVASSQDWCAPLACRAICHGRQLRICSTLTGVDQFLITNEKTGYDEAVFEFLHRSDYGVLRLSDWREYYWHVARRPCTEWLVTNSDGITIFQTSRGVGRHAGTGLAVSASHTSNPAVIQNIDLAASSVEQPLLMLMLAVDFALQQCPLPDMWDCLRGRRLAPGR